MNAEKETMTVETKAPRKSPVPQNATWNNMAIRW